MDTRKEPDLNFALPLLVAAATFLVFLPVLDNGFVNWDDPFNILDNPHFRGLDFPRLKWMFTTLHHGLYQPLAWLSFGADFTLWGMTPGGYHLTSLALFTASAVVLFRLIHELLAAAFPDAGRDRALAWAAAAGALAFSLHPLRVEAVAWATERREILCGLFTTAAALFYLRARAGGARRSLALCAGAHALALLSKGSAVTVPLALLVLDAIPLGRRRAERPWALIREKIPLLLLSLAAGIIGLAAQAPHGDLLSFERYGFLDRLAFACHAAAFYPFKTLWPSALSPLYEIPRPMIPYAPRFLLAFAAVFAATGAAWWGRRRLPALAAAWAAYLILLFPSCGIVQLGAQLVADRYSNLPGMAVAALLAGGLYRLLARRPQSRGKILACATAVLAGLGALSWRQAGIWKDTRTLWTRALELDPACSTASNNLGLDALARGNEEEARARFEAALLSNGTNVRAQTNLALLLLGRGRAKEAAVHLDAALRQEPESPVLRRHLADALSAMGRNREALTAYREALQRAPQPDGFFNLGALLARMGRKPEASAAYRSALALSPSHSQANLNLGLLRLEGGDPAAAREFFRRAALGPPPSAEGHFGWGNCLAALGDHLGAETRYREALRLSPGMSRARFNLGNSLARRGKFAEAAVLFREVLKVEPGFPRARESLAAALRLAGRSGGGGP